MNHFRKSLGYQKITGLDSAKGLTVPAAASSASITCTAKDVMWRDDGTAPTATDGFPLRVLGEPMSYGGDLSKIKFIETAASAVLHVLYFCHPHFRLE